MSKSSEVCQEGAAFSRWIEVGWQTTMVWHTFTLRVKGEREGGQGGGQGGKQSRMLLMVDTGPLCCEYSAEPDRKSVV